MRDRRCVAAALGLLVGGALAGCGEGGAPVDAAVDVAVADAARDAAAVLDAATGPVTDAAACAPADGFGGGEARIVPGAVMATLVDESGAPVAAGQPVFLCGLDVCSAPSKVGANGSAAIATTLAMKRPAFKFGDALHYAEFGVPVGTAATDLRSGPSSQSMGPVPTAKLDGAPGAPLAPGRSATSGDVTVAIAAGASLAIDPLTYTTPDEQQLRAVRIPVEKAAAILPSAPRDFALLYGLAPAETEVCPPARLTVALPPGLGWAPGAKVEVWITSTDVSQTRAPYAGWAKASEAVVASDGKSITTVDGQGLPRLGNLALRLE